MSATTKIQWTEQVWNPTTGCDRTSPGCDSCYALTMAKRLKAMGSEKYQTDGNPATSGPGFGLAMHQDTLDAPLHWRAPRLVFVNSMSDLFHDGVTDEFIAQVFAVMAATPQHTYQLLTKRHGRMRSLIGRRGDGGQALMEATSDERTAKLLADAPWPLPNLWLGVSVEDQKHAALRIPALLETDAAVRWISAEPLLGPIDLYRLEARGVIIDALGGNVTLPSTGEVFTGTPSVLDWLVCGGESGKDARPMDPAWVRSIVEACRGLYDTQVFVKQLGSRWAKDNGAADSKGGDPDEWSAELRVRDFPRAGAR